MGEYEPYTTELITAEHARQHTLPNGLSTLIRLANDATHLSYPHTELEYMFNSIRDVKEAHEEASNHTGTVAQERVTAAQEYKRTIAWSHMPLVVSSAFDTYRSDGCTSLEDYIQSGIEGLYSAIDVYATSTDRQGFTELARVHVKATMRRQRLQDIFSTDVGKTLLNALYPCLRAQRQGENLSDPKVLQKIGRQIEASPTTISGVLRLMNVFKFGHISLETPEGAAAAAIGEDREPSTSQMEKPFPTNLQMALLLLSPQRRRTIERFYGLDAENPSYNLEEISSLDQITPGTARKHHDDALAELRTIMQNFEMHGTSFDRWPDCDYYFRQNLSVLTYLHRAKIAIPTDRQVTELCIIAMQDLTKRNIPDKYKRIVADMYGLHNGQRMTIAQLTKVYGLSSGRYSQIAKSALAADYV